MQYVVHQLGFIGYEKACKLQRELLQQRFDGTITDTILLLEHIPTITIGKSGKIENILVSQIELASQGISFCYTDRGGDVTYHGPGQLVVYPIIDLRQRGRDIRRYVRELEEVIIRTLKDYSIDAQRDEKHPGVWVKNEEIAAIGLSVKKWISMHGIALNVNPDMNHFALINPCGFTDRKATSMAEILSRDISVEEIQEKVVTHFADVFNVQIEWEKDKVAGSYR